FFMSMGPSIPSSALATPAVPLDWPNEGIMLPMECPYESLEGPRSTIAKDGNLRPITTWVAEKRRAALWLLADNPERSNARQPKVNRSLYYYFDDTTCRLLVTEKIPGTPLARTSARFLSVALSTTPSNVT